jgi:1-deoxy-D-xylulose-5-phosphate synthase
LDTDLVTQLATHHKALITVEQGAMGGFGSIVLNHLVKEALLTSGLAVDTMVIPDRFIDQGDPNSMYIDAQLSSSHILEKCDNLLKRVHKTIAPQKYIRF